MATSQMNEVIQHLRRAVLLHEGAGLTDGQLLEDYISRRDQAALAALVRRHGPMVWGVCRRVVCNHHDAEDAFQATFLVLVRKAVSIVPRQMVANWLYGVAHQTALNARVAAAKRKGRERQVTEMPEPAAAEQGQWHDLQPLLDEELSHLPDMYRAVIVLCDLEGKTRKEAARQLACPEGTVAGRLARARAMLAKRLNQRGVLFSGGSVAAVLSAGSASGSAPPALVASTIKAASLLAAGQAAGVVSAKVAALSEGVVNAMFTTKIKSVLAVVLIVGLTIGGIGAAIGLSTNSVAVAQQPGAKTDGKAVVPGDKEKKADVKKPAEKERKVLTPEEAIKRMPKENVTVQFKVASVEVDGPYFTFPVTDVIYLKDGGKFTARLIDNDFTPLNVHMKKLGIETVEDFKGKMVRVTGRFEPESGNESFTMWVRDHADIEIVKK